VKWWQTDGGCGPRLDGALFAMIFCAVAVIAYLIVLGGMIWEALS
jgi:hypothetical protein